ncbi:MAG: insulinase family protein, partial [Paracoccaceae bacterium]|nr:insulinase family protein [Paracoccaceae bacterium]
MIRWIALAAFWIAGLGPAAAAIEVQEVTSPGGIKAWLVEEHSIPFTALEIRFRGGSALDEAGKRGATYLMTATLEEGAADMDARAFAERVESLAASFRFNVYDDVLAISARFLTENSDQAVDLLKSAIMQPRFDQDAIDRVRGQIQAVLLSETTNPRNIAGQAFNAATWGDHPYATNAKGTPESLDALTREDLISARNR